MRNTTYSAVFISVFVVAFFLPGPARDVRAEEGKATAGEASVNSATKEGFASEKEGFRKKTRESGQCPVYIGGLIC